MPSSLTKLGVWNLAIDVIKDTALQTTQDNTATSRWLERNWQHAVETTLRTYVWNFSKKFVKLPADATPPAFKWQYSYKPPAGWLRVLYMTEGGERYGRPIPHEIVGDRIFTNEPPPLCVPLVMDVSANPGLWDPLFVEIVRCKLGLGMANKFTSKAKYIELASQLLKQATDQAELIDALEGSAEPVEQFDILRARGADPNTARGWR